MTTTTHDERWPEEGPWGHIAPSRVTLRPLTRADRAAVRRWMADPNVIRFTVLVPGPEYAPVRPYGSTGADRYLDTLLADPARRSFAICVDGRHVGNVGLKELDLRGRRAECFIELGEADVRGRGVGAEAMRKLLRYAFEDLDLEEVRLGVFEFNEPAIRLYRHLGFAFAGRYGLHYTEGRFWEVLAMVLRRDTWRRSR